MWRLLFLIGGPCAFISLGWAAYHFLVAWWLIDIDEWKTQSVFLVLFMYFSCVMLIGGELFRPRNDKP